jgi:putative heme-binding domain-containing protein
LPFQLSSEHFQNSDKDKPARLSYNLQPERAIRTRAAVRGGPQVYLVVPRPSNVSLCEKVPVRVKPAGDAEMRECRARSSWIAVMCAAAALPAAVAVAPVQKEWTMADLLPAVADLGSGRDWARGRDLFKKTACGVCHAFGSHSEGTGLAPDLTGVGTMYSREFLLQSILEPSATINGRFYHTRFTLKDGTVITGSVVDAANGKILVAPVMMNPQATVAIAQADVKSEEPSPISPMPGGLLNALTKDEVVELMAFLDSGGDRNAPVYRKR